MNEYEKELGGTPERTSAEQEIETLRQEGGVFVDAVRVTRMPMMVTAATLPGNPIVFANAAFSELSGYSVEEVLGQNPMFMNGEATDPEAIRQYETALRDGREITLEILQYRRHDIPFYAMLFNTPLKDDQGRIVYQFLSFLDITARHQAETKLRTLAAELEQRVADRTQELESANERLRDLVAQRDLLMVEVNHRAKNSLAAASSLLSIQGMRQGDPAIRSQFDAARDRLNGMAQVHDLLSRSEDAQQVDLASYLTNLREAMQPAIATDDRIRLQADAESIVVSADTAFRLGIVLTELITNAVKYAFPPPRSGTILTQVRRLPENRLELVVRDDGIGMIHGREGSLGFGLIRSIVDQIDGEINLRNDAGLTVAISFPYPPGSA